ncbi:DUF2591 domain-containing protein [Enterobacter hormaechei]|uniref:phage protein NinX family protein n=1 Tax=Enterobacter hormaechei TaxID=158836 RepID=UPI001142E741|nr:phage protein NinX family protein [Enterobacter hormaechei]TQD12947.1 DUF2591 domain-containing protein [Enterobacter hormaechei]
MDYSKLSDTEINAAVADELNKVHQEMLFMFNPAGYVYRLGYGNIESPYSDGEPEEVIFDPVNSWSDAGEIIADNEINILWNWNEEGLHGATALPLYEYEHENALRAAMIVFLMIQGSSDVQDNPA